jgi:hypothetical protein
MQRANALHKFLREGILDDNIMGLGSDTSSVIFVARKSDLATHL